MKPYLIGVGGQFGSGKDEFCNRLAARLNDYGEWHRAALADNVKDIYCRAFGVTREFVEEWKRVDSPPPGFAMSVRRGLTFIGDGFRQMCPTVWIDMLFKGNTRNLVVSDARYINEAEYIRDHGGLTVLLWRPGHENDFQNASEQELMPFVDELRDQPDGLLLRDDIPFHLWIRNDGTLADLLRKVDEVVLPFAMLYFGEGG